jgi:hypothetical protein
MDKQVWRYLELEEALNPPDVVSRVKLLIDLVLQPAGHVLFWMCFLAFPSLLRMLGYTESPTKWKLLWYLMGTARVVWVWFTGWRDMIEYYHLGTLFLVTHIRYARTPFQYEIQSDRPSHQLFKYAALTALERPSGSPRTSPGTT